MSASDIERVYNEYVKREGSPAGLNTTAGVAYAICSVGKVIGKAIVAAALIMKS